MPVVLQTALAARRYLAQSDLEITMHNRVITKQYNMGLTAE
jgi:hypothetical protein